MQVQSYLFFDGRCEEALAFYAKALGAEVTMMMRYQDSPVPQQGGPEGCAPMPGDKIMHASFRVGETQLMASDGMAVGQAQFKGFSLSIAVPSDAEARRTFDALADGGQVQMPLTATFFASSFGMVADRFGVSWMVIVPLPMP